MKTLDPRKPIIRPCGGPFFSLCIWFVYRWVPRKNRARVPRPLWEPITGPTSPMRISYAHQQHPRGQRIQRPGMAYLQIFLPEMPARSPFQLPDHVCRRPPVRLVHRDDYPTWKVVHVAGELAAKENLVRYQNLFFHYTGILSIRLWWRPPSNWVESHVFRMRVAIG